MSTPPPSDPARRPRVFVSHSHMDELAAQRLAAALQRAGADVWIESAQLHAGDQIEIVERGLATCDWLVLLETPEALASAWVNLEVNTALNRVGSGTMRGVIRLVVQPHPAATTPLLWTTLRAYDATVDFEGAVATMLAAIRRDDEREVVGPPSDTQRGAASLSRPPTAAVLDTRRLHALIAAADLAEAWRDVVDLTYSLLATHPSAVTADDLRMRGRALLALARPVEAAESLQAAYDRDRYHPLIIRNYAQALRALERYGEAAALYGRALALSDDDETQLAILREYLTNCQAQSRWDVALSLTDQALRLRPYDLDWLNLRLTTLIHLNRQDWALVSLYEQLMADLPSAHLPPDFAHWLTVAYAFRAAFPDVAMGNTGGDDDGNSSDPDAEMIQLVHKLDDLVAQSAVDPDLKSAIDPDLKPYLVRAHNLLLRGAEERKTVYLAVDLSHRRTGAALAEIQRAAYEFVQACNLDEIAIGLLGYSVRVQIYQTATQNARAITDAISRLQAGVMGDGDGDQPFLTLYDLMGLGRGRRYGVVVADGPWADPALSIECARRCHNAGIEIFAVGLDGADQQFLAALASARGRSIVSSQGKLPETFITIAHELSAV